MHGDGRMACSNMASLADWRLKIDNDRSAPRHREAYSVHMHWDLYYEQDHGGYWVVTDYAYHKTDVGPFTLESDAVDVAVDARAKIRAVYGFGAFLEDDMPLLRALPC